MNTEVHRETKLLATKAIVSNYARNEKNSLSADELCDLIKKVYGAIEETVPEPEKRKVGLG